MDYQLRLSNGETYSITEKEAQELMLGNKKGLTGINSLMGVINMSFVTSIIPKDKIDKNTTKVGYLHDGTRVVKQGGVWLDATNTKLWLDTKYYPEVAYDKVFTESEFEKVKQLPKEERLEMLLKDKKQHRIGTTNGLEKLLD